MRDTEHFTTPRSFICRHPGMVQCFLKYYHVCLARLSRISVSLPDLDMLAFLEHAGCSGSSTNVLPIEMCRHTIVELFVAV